MPAKRILLMYISQVSGHRSAAEAVEKAIKIIAPETDILCINAFNYTNPISEKVINSIYMKVISRAPKIWDYLYDNPAVARKLQKIKDKVHKFNSPKIKKLLDDFRPDAVACTQAFPCGMVADYKKIYHSAIPLVAILTDYVPHTYWIYDTVDYYISPSQEVSDRLMQKGIATEKIRTFGIPFDPKFNQPVDKTKVLSGLGLDSGIPTIMIMGGSHGLGPMEELIGSLEKIKGAFQEIVVCGANLKLYQKLTKKIKKWQKKIVVLGFADNVQELMNASDLIITKPGGITVAEALAKSIPMIIIKPLPGQEANNTMYLIAKQAALKLDDLNNAGQIVEGLLLNQQRLSALKEAAGRISKPCASMDIAKLLLSL